MFITMRTALIDAFSYLLTAADPKISADGHHVENAVLNTIDMYKFKHMVIMWNSKTKMYYGLLCSIRYSYL